MVWAEYEKEQERKSPGCIYRKGFKYPPPILPVVLYDGRGPWTAEASMRGKVEMGDVFAAYIPHFDYALVDLHEYTIGDLSKQNNALSLMLILDRLQSSAEFASILERLPEGYMDRLKRATPERVLHVLADIVRIYMHRAGVALYRIEETARTVAEGRFENMFSVFAENFAQEKQYARQEGRREGRQEGRHEGKLEIARAMFAADEDLCNIRRFTKLPEETLLELKRKYDKNRDKPGK